MPPPFPIQIAGGGLAGLTLGIALRRQDVPVTIFEAGRYPRHRVCGEFINGRGVEVLETLGLKRKLFDAGAFSAETAAFFIGRSQSPARRLPRPAVCLSRFVMDELLAAEFQRLGGDLRLGSRWQNDFGEGVVRATGRRLHSPADGCHWFGLKAHAANVSLAADLEMHLLDN
ncbi:MAG TPA: FAD-dependent monooxygenase, partial [Verrucomicrobiae bacterium]|nr:FAD-dependent monooxygenase [Verrucomicrobiae bacterium]